MLRNLRSSLSYANVTATIAVFIALGGTGYAAVTLAPNSVGAKQLKKSAVTGSKVAANAVTSAKVKDGSLRAADFNPTDLGALKGPKGDPGAAGAKGDTGATGPIGPSDVYSAKSNDPCGGTASPDLIHPHAFCLATLSLTLPAGNYAVSGKITFANATGTVGDGECYFADGGDISLATVPISGETVADPTLHKFGTATVYVQEDVALPTGGTVTMKCQNTGASDVSDGGSNDLGLGYERLHAIKVGAVH
jgi:hypothetical protein